MRRRTFLKSTLAAAALPWLESVRAAGPADVQRPNFIFLLTDDQQWRTLHCAGNSIIQTPHIDALAARGVMFHNNFVTTAICQTSRASIFTGLYLGTHKILNFEQGLTPELKAISYPWILGAAGYHTGYIGKYHVGNEMPVKDFDYWDGFPGLGVYFHRVNGKWRHLTEMQGDSALRFLETIPRDRPFCLTLGFKDPHVIDHLPAPFQPDPQYDGLYRDVEIPLPPNRGKRGVETDPGFPRYSLDHMRGWRMDTDARYQENVKQYYRSITGVDTQVGRICAALQASGRAENTIIIYTSDNGYFLGEHQFEGKWLMHEESIRTPLIIADPRFPAQHGSSVNAMTLNVDCCPTILELAGLPIPAVAQGKSMVPLLRGEHPPDWRTDWFYEHLLDYTTMLKIEGVRGERWKYIRYLDSAPPFEELFDLQQDPGEMNNLAAQLPSELKKMRRRYRQLRAQYVTDSFPHPGFPGRVDPRLDLLDES